MPDILIAGAGPAGLSAAHWLSRQHIPHLLIDQSSFPRDKICGDAISEKVLLELEALWPGSSAGLGKNPAFHPSFGVRFVAPDGTEVQIPFKENPENPAGYVVPRLEFDHFLAQKLDSDYTTALWNSRVTGLTKTELGEIQLEIGNGASTRRITTRLLIDASGERAVVREKLLRQPFSRQHFSAGLRSYYDGIRGLHKQGFIELFFLSEAQPGYFWIFPQAEGRANVGLGILSSTVARKKINLRRLFFDLIAHHPELKTRFAAARPLTDPTGWGLPLGSEKGPRSGDHFLLCGDAGALIDPFTGEGIGNALLSGRLASTQAAKALQANNFSASFLAGYDSELNARLRDELRISYSLQRLAARPWLFNFVLRKVSRSRFLQQTITGMFSNVDSRKQFRNPLFYLRLLFG